MEGQLGGSYLDAILHGCLTYAEQAETSVVICRMSFEQVEKGEWPTALRRGQLDGVVLRGWWQQQVSSWLKENKVPCVLVDCDQYVSSLPQVQIENIQAMDSLVDYLTESGSKRFVTITGDMEHLNAQERLAGLQMALVRRGLTLPPDQIAVERGFDEASGQRGVQTLLSRNVGFDTLVCQNDLIAYGALQALKQAGLVVPDQVRLTGFDNMDVGHRFDVPIITVDPQPATLGREGVKLLLQTIEGDSLQPVHLRLPAKLVVRT
ncbi:LacI family DNA-binding transcriptional regulator [Phycisphaerales bacterium AB-hyl4]|uniref:LacI family DNA-binding transcriptional regulator n=1 Tax=Natronomicrosphaera hydrolytica TaxID=3242702 RepID=A0ABV4U5K6_9BACT